jgi:hypothetical protein
MELWSQRRSCFRRVCQDGLGRSMRNHWRITLVLALAVLGAGVAANAQESSRFNRVTTPGVRRNIPSTSPGGPRVARSAGMQAVVATSFRADSLRPYSALARAQTQASGSGVPQSSTWQQESRPVVAPEVVQEPPQARSYFPGMRSSRFIQQPVTLTARSGGHICTPCRAQMIGGGHHR